MNTFTPTEYNPYDERPADDADLPFEDAVTTLPYGFTYAPAVPDMQACRAAAFNLLDREDDLAEAVCELPQDADISIRPGAIVRYHWRGYGSFDGTVTTIDEAGRVEVETCDEWGERRYWCAADRLTLLLCAEAAALGEVG